MIVAALSHCWDHFAKNIVSVEYFSWRVLCDWSHEWGPIAVKKSINLREMNENGKKTINLLHWFVNHFHGETFDLVTVTSTYAAFNGILFLVNLCFSFYCRKVTRFWWCPSDVPLLGAKWACLARGHCFLLWAIVCHPITFFWAIFRPIENGIINGIILIFDFKLPTECVRFAWKFSYLSFGHVAVAHSSILLPFAMCFQRSIWFQVNFCNSLTLCVILWSDLNLI